MRLTTAKKLANGSNFYLYRCQLWGIRRAGFYLNGSSYYEPVKREDAMKAGIPVFD